jgi:predicted SnoaL-like aldol condensation-catalyzing enzyme
MAEEENKAKIFRNVEALNRKDLTVLDEYIAEDYIDHTNQFRGREDVRLFYARLFRQVPDFHRTVEDIIAEGDKVWAIIKTTGTDTAGKKIDVVSVTILRIIGGKAVEGWTVPQIASVLPRAMSDEKVRE